MPFVHDATSPACQRPVRVPISRQRNLRGSHYQAPGYIAGSIPGRRQRWPRPVVLCLLPPKPLRIALLGYRSQPFAGGQGVYLRYLSKALVDAGHRVDVISGPPYPQLDPRVRLIQLPSLDLFENGLLSLRPRHLKSLTQYHRVVQQAHRRLRRALHLRPTGGALPAPARPRLRPHPR